MEEEIRQIIRQCKLGNIGSFATLVTRYGGRVSGIIYHMIGYSSNTDDLAQEVFIKAYRNLTHFRETAKFSTWLYRITVNTVYDYLRKQKVRTTIPLDKTGPLPVPETITTGAQKAELKQLLNRELQKLPLKYRTVLILKEFEGFSYKEIADVLHCRIGTVESRLFRARNSLLDKIKKTNWWRDYQ